MEKRKILIVDDEEGFARVVKLNLEESGRYEIRTETKGVRALQVARAFQPDLILLDVVMPDISGPEVAREIKADKSIQHIPIVFLTAAELKGAGVGDQGSANWLPFIAKPVGTKELIAHIEKHIQKS